MIAKALLCGLRYDEWLLGGCFCISKWLVTNVFFMVDWVLLSCCYGI